MLIIGDKGTNFYLCRQYGFYRTLTMHLTGHAADIHIPNNATGRKWMEWIIDNCQFYKMIWETADKKHFWIHVSYLEGENLNHVVSYLLKSPQSPNR